LTGAVGGYAFSANGLFDPNFSGTGHQPIGFDQAMIFYTQYCVVRSAIKIYFVNTCAYALNTLMYLSPDGTILSVFDRAVENGLARRMVLPGSNIAGYCSSLELECDVRKYFGCRTNQDLLSNSVMTGTAAANPAEGVYFVISFQDIGQAASITAELSAEISYDVIFWEPRKATES
jgi:hypothetical protein